MNQRSKIRQCALHYIYAKLQGGESSFSDELFWDISLEKERDQYRRSLSKMVCHNGRNSQDSYRLLEERLNTMLDVAADDMSTANLREELKRFMDQSSKLENLLLALGHALSDKRQDGTDVLLATCTDTINTADILNALAPELRFSLQDYPAYKKYTEGLQAVIRRRSAISERIGLLRNVDALPADGEYKALVHAANDLAAIQPAAQELAQQVLAQKDRWEGILEPLLQNYSLDRLDLLDKCLLYLMLYELKVLELPLPVIVSEGTALANAYSGSKSATFIHGVLAAAHKADSKVIIKDLISGILSEEEDSNEPLSE